MLRATGRLCSGIALLVLAGCMHRVDGGGGAEMPRPPAPPGPMLHVFVYSEEPKLPLDNASVVLIGNGSAQTIAVTDGSGTVTLDKMRLREPGNLALLFCFNQDPMACSAIRLDVGKVMDMNELTVNVPIPKVIDRSLVRSK